MYSISEPDHATVLSELCVPTHSRVLILGCSCSGKSELAIAISQATGLPHYDLDGLYWTVNWGHSDESVFIGEVQKLCQKSEWVIDCVYPQPLEALARRANYIIWLDPSFAVVLLRCVKRSLLRGFRKEVLFHGNVETLKRSFLSTDSVIIPAIRDFWRHRRTNGQLCEKYKAGKHVIRTNGREALAIRIPQAPKA